MYSSRRMSRILDMYLYHSLASSENGNDQTSHQESTPD